MSKKGAETMTYQLQWDDLPEEIAKLTENMTIQDKGNMLDLLLDLDVPGECEVKLTFKESLDSSSKDCSKVVDYLKHIIETLENGLGYLSAPADTTYTAKLFLLNQEKYIPILKLIAGEKL